MATGNKLDPDKEGKCVDIKTYRGMIGSLLYLTATRPEILFSVCACARFQANPKEPHFLAVKIIFRYLRQTQNLGLFYAKSYEFDLRGYSDSDYGGCKIDAKSTTAGCHFLGNKLISWQCKK